MLNMTLEQLESVFDPHLFEDWMQEFGDDLDSEIATVQEVHFTGLTFHRVLRDLCRAEIDNNLNSAIEKAQQETQSRLKHKNSEYPSTRKYYAEAHQTEQDLRRRRALLENAVTFHEQMLRYHGNRWFGSFLPDVV